MPFLSIESNMTSLELARQFIRAAGLAAAGRDCKVTAESLARDIDTYAREFAEPLFNAGCDVVKNWVEGDLAEAVRNLTAELEAFTESGTEIAAKARAACNAHTTEQREDGAARAASIAEAAAGDLVFLTWDHPEAEGRKPKAGDVEYSATFTLPGGRKILVRMGETGFQSHTQLMLDVLARAPSHDDGSIARNLVKEMAAADECVRAQAQLIIQLRGVLTQFKLGADLWAPPDGPCDPDHEGEVLALRGLHARLLTVLDLTPDTVALTFQGDTGRIDKLAKFHVVFRKPVTEGANAGIATHYVTDFHPTGSRETLREAIDSL